MPYLVKSKRGSGRKVHQATENNRPVCGGGRSGKSILAWQEDLGPASCKRCKQLLEMKAISTQRRKGAKAQKEVVKA